MGFEDLLTDMLCRRSKFIDGIVKGPLKKGGRKGGHGRRDTDWYMVSFSDGETVSVQCTAENYGVAWRRETEEAHLDEDKRKGGRAKVSSATKAKMKQGASVNARATELKKDGTTQPRSAHVRKEMCGIRPAESLVDVMPGLGKKPKQSTASRKGSLQCGNDSRSMKATVETNLSSPPSLPAALRGKKESKSNTRKAGAVEVGVSLMNKVADTVVVSSDVNTSRAELLGTASLSTELVEGRRIGINPASEGSDGGVEGSGEVLRSADGTELDDTQNFRKCQVHGCIQLTRTSIKSELSDVVPVVGNLKYRDLEVMLKAVGWKGDKTHVKMDVMETAAIGLGLLRPSEREASTFRDPRQKEGIAASDESQRSVEF